jgi:Domain of unknown function (DUF1996)
VRLSFLWIVAVCLLSVACSKESAHSAHGGPTDSDFVDIQAVAATVAPARTGGSTGTWTAHCGRNENGHRNADNVVAQPGIGGGAHHVHDYVGNLSTDAFSTNESLAAAGTTCDQNDKSTYYWPVLRLVDEVGPDANAVGGGVDGNHGKVVQADSVLVQFRGTPASNVVAMPDFLRAITGNPVAVSQDGANSEHVQWSCSGQRDRVTNLYPRCPDGQQVVRIFDFPNCWDGKATDSKLHRAHLAFPAADGACAVGSFPVPQLHIEVAYSLPPGERYAIDSFPEESRNPITDHAMAIVVMPAGLINHVTDCVNSGKHC